jgi:ketosteroid isomerase-like protein
MSFKIKHIVVILSVTIIFVLSPISAQELSKEQSEIWNQIESFWKFYFEKDLEGCLNHFHEDYIGWSYRDQLPHDKSDLENSIKYNLQNYNTESYEIKLANISTFKNMAIVHFFYSGIYSDSAGNTGSYKGRMTDILIKQDDKWVFVADHGGSVKD